MTKPNVEGAARLKSFATKKRIKEGYVVLVDAVPEADLRREEFLRAEAK